MSARLRAEPVVRGHARAMAETLSDPLLFEFLSEAPPSEESLEFDYDFLTDGRSPDGKESWLTWILLPHAKDTPVGFVQATVAPPETVHVAYVIGRAYWRLGYAREAVSSMLDVVFRRWSVARAIAEMDTRNVASVRLVESLGFRRVATVFGATKIRAVVSDEFRYELTRDEWRRREPPFPKHHDEYVAGGGG